MEPVDPCSEKRPGGDASGSPAAPPRGRLLPPRRAAEAAAGARLARRILALGRWLWLKEPESQNGFVSGKWNGPRPAVCPSCFILGHTQVGVARAGVEMDGCDGGHRCPFWWVLVEK